MNLGISYLMLKKSVKKKVLIISESSVFYDKNADFIVRGGGASSMHNIAKSFFDLGFDVDFFAVQEFVDQSKFEIIDGVKYMRELFCSRSSLKLLKFLMWAIKKSKDYDYVVLNQFLPHLILPFLRQKKTLAVVHDVYMEKKRFWFRRFNFLLAFFGVLVEFLQIKFDKYFATKIMVVSNSTKTKLLDKIGRKYVKKVFVNSYPIDKSDYLIYDLDKFEEPYLLFVGRFVSYKNPDHVLKFLKKLDDEYLKFRVKFVVTRKFEEYFKEFEKKVFDMGLEDRVDFLFSVSTMELRKLYAAAFVLIHPSEVEGQGIVVLEALASKLPVLAYDLPAYAGMLVSGKNSELCEIGNIDALSEAFLKIVNNYHFYVENTKLTLDDYSSENFKKQLKSKFLLS